MPRAARLPLALLAVVAAIAVANTYYLQPLLHLFSERYRLAGGAAGLFVTVTQGGYVLGLATLLPLGDRFDRRRLMLVAMVASAACDAVVAEAHGVVILVLGLFGLGTFSAAAQLAVTYAAAAAPPERRARSVATVMGGLLAGIVLARTYAGWLGQFAGVAAVFAVAAAACLLLAVGIWLRLPREAVPKERAVSVLYRSALRLLRDERLLALRAGLGFLSFAAFSMFWTTMALVLSAAPYWLNAGAIGLFGFAGLAGVLAARVVGRLADHGFAGATTVVSFVLITLSWAGLYLDRSSVLAFAMLTAVLDAGIQGAQLSNQSAIYLLAPGAQGRVTMVYMVCYFLGGVVGSSGASVLFGMGGFRLVAFAGACIGLAGIAVMALLGRAEAGWRRSARLHGTSRATRPGAGRLDRWIA
jgi:predicted MFS family arabinose efflux permease